MGLGRRSPEQGIVEDVLALWWAGTMVSVVALAFALTLDGIGSRGDVDPGRERIPVSA